MSNSAKSWTRIAQKKKLKSSDVVLTYNGDQIFLSGTPAGLGMNDIQIYNMRK